VRFYPDLEDPELAVPFAIFHQRFSTNTEPSWERAQPFRLLCHNGEINTIDGNVTWSEARERARGDEPASHRRSTGPAPTPRSSTTRSSSSFARTALEIAEALSVLVPPAWQNDPRLDDEVRDFHRYGAMLSEPWDGPAALCFTDGRTCGAALDRNGLRPLRIAVAGDELLAVSSEAGAVPMPDGVPLRRSRLGPGGVVTLDPDRGLLFDSELRRDLARRRPYGAWVEGGIVRVGTGAPVTSPEGSLDARHVLHGYTREELNGMLRPLAQSGHDPVSSMGDDSAIAPSPAATGR
jgi:glutamate synthase (ferredoxin)